MLSKEEKLARLTLFRSETVGASSFWNIIKLCGNAVNALNDLPKISAKINGNFKICDNEKIATEIENMKSIGARFIFLEDELYPPLLKNIPDPPPILAFLGNRDKLQSFYSKKIISVVGSRNASLHATKFCANLCASLGINDVVTISGLARGIDACVHQACIETGTIAIVACGINIAYPSENEKLYHQIITNGAIFSEMPFDTAPQPQLFPRRNRIIAGMSTGTIVVEAAIQSGSLITAKMALEYNREVFAVPGFPIDPRSVGCNSLIKNGATLIQNADDVLTLLSTEKKIQNNLFDNYMALHCEAQIIDTDNIKEKILNSLTSCPITIDELISSIKVSPREVLAALLELEMVEKIERLHGQRVCLSINNQ